MWSCQEIQKARKLHRTWNNGPKCRDCKKTENKFPAFLSCSSTGNKIPSFFHSMDTCHTSPQVYESFHFVSRVSCKKGIWKMQKECAPESGYPFFCEHPEISETKVTHANLLNSENLYCISRHAAYTIYIYFGLTYTQQTFTSPPAAVRKFINELCWNKE